MINVTKSYTIYLDDPDETIEYEIPARAGRGRLPVRYRLTMIKYTVDAAAAITPDPAALNDLSSTMVFAKRIFQNGSETQSGPVYNYPQEVDTFVVETIRKYVK